jgi:hypothetical protein
MAAVPLTGAIILMLGSTLGQFGLLVLVAAAAIGLFLVLWMAMPPGRAALLALQVATVVFILLAGVFALSLRSDNRPIHQAGKCFAGITRNPPHATVKSRPRHAVRHKTVRRVASAGPRIIPAVSPSPAVRAVKIRSSRHSSPRVETDHGATVAPAAGATPPRFHPAPRAPAATEPAAGAPAGAIAPPAPATAPSTPETAASPQPVAVAAPRPAAGDTGGVAAQDTVATNGAGPSTEDGSASLGAG